MDIQSILGLIFLVILSLIIYFYRKKIHFQKIIGPLLWFAMFKTKLGIKQMDSIAKRLYKPLRYIGYFAVFIGFLGMLVIAEELVRNIINIVIKPEAVPGVGLVLPFEVKGAFFVPFFYWIVSIFILAVVHEFSHGVMARRYGMQIKSSGFAVLGIVLPVLPAAFVEPDEKELQSRPANEQLSVFAAGPFANIVFAFIIFGLLGLIAAPVVNSLLNFNGVEVTGFIEGDFPAKKAGMQEKEIIKEIDGIEVNYLENFTDALKNKKPGDKIKIITDKNNYSIELGKNPQNESMPYLGVYVQQNREVKPYVAEKYGKILSGIVLWFLGLFYWLYLLNLGIGLFNLVPIGPIDGGRMLKVALHKFFKKKRADNLWKAISAFFLVLVIITIMVSFLR